MNDFAWDDKIGAYIAPNEYFNESFLFPSCLFAHALHIRNIKKHVRDRLDVTQNARSQIRGWITIMHGRLLKFNDFNRSEAHLNFSFPHFLCRYYICFIFLSLYLWNFPIDGVCVCFVLLYTWSQFSFSHFICVSMARLVLFKNSICRPFILVLYVYIKPRIRMLDVRWYFVFAWELS